MNARTTDERIAELRNRRSNRKPPTYSYRVKQERYENGTMLFIPQYRRGDCNAPWRSYRLPRRPLTGMLIYAYEARQDDVRGKQEAYELAYAVLESHATPADLAVNLIQQ